jgi:hypothetical protein
VKRGNPHKTCSDLIHKGMIVPAGRVKGDLQSSIFLPPGNAIEKLHDAFHKIRPVAPFLSVHTSGGDILCRTAGFQG